MSEVNLVEVRKRHKKCQGHWSTTGKAYNACEHDGRPWPCDAIQLADEIERQAEALRETSRVLGRSYCMGTNDNREKQIDEAQKIVAAALHPDDSGDRAGKDGEVGDKHGQR